MCVPSRTRSDFSIAFIYLFHFTYQKHIYFANLTFRFIHVCLLIKFALYLMDDSPPKVSCSVLLKCCTELKDKTWLLVVRVTIPS